MGVRGASRVPQPLAKVTGREPTERSWYEEGSDPPPPPPCGGPVVLRGQKSWVLLQSEVRD